MGNREFVRVRGRLYDVAPFRQGPAVSALRDRVNGPRQGAAVVHTFGRDCTVDLARPLRDDGVGPVAQVHAKTIFDDVSLIRQGSLQHCISSMLTPSGAAT